MTAAEKWRIARAYCPGLSRTWRPRRPRGGRGNCYAAVEALWHLMPPLERAMWVPCQVRHEGDSHWYLQHRLYNTIVIDPTAAQFRRPPPYHRGRSRGFLTQRPSTRARALMEKILWQPSRKRR